MKSLLKSIKYPNTQLINTLRIDIGINGKNSYFPLSYEENIDNITPEHGRSQILCAIKNL